MTQQGGSDDPLADRAMATLRRYEFERTTRPAWRAKTYDRVFARTIDLAVPFLLGIAVIYVLTAMSAFGEVNEAQTPATEGGAAGAGQPELTVSWGFVWPSPGDLAGIAGLLGALVAYEAVTTWLLGATPGKRILGLRVTEDDGGQLHNPGRFMLRTLGVVLPIGIALAMWYTSVLMAWGAIAIIVIMAWRALNPNSDGMTFYDRLAGTAVADARAEPNAH